MFQIRDHLYPYSKLRSNILYSFQIINLTTQFEPTAKMPKTRSQPTKSKRHEWDHSIMEKAIQFVLDKQGGFKKAAVQFGVPRTTLFRY